MLPYLIPQTMKLLIFITRARDKGKFWGTDEMRNFFKVFLAIQVNILSFMAKWYSIALWLWIPTAIISTGWLYYWEITSEWQLF